MSGLTTVGNGPSVAQRWVLTLEFVGRCREMDVAKWEASDLARVAVLLAEEVTAWVVAFHARLRRQTNEEAVEVLLGSVGLLDEGLDGLPAWL